KSNAARPIFPGGRAPAAFQCSRPAIIRCTTRNRSPSRPMAMRLPTRVISVTRRPAAAELGGSTERRTKGLTSRTRSSTAPATRVSRASMYTVTSGSSGIRLDRSGPGTVFGGTSAAAHGRALRGKGSHDTMSTNGPAPPRAPSPPTARRVTKIDIVHGEQRVDDYFWLRRKDDPEVHAYLVAENAYADSVMRPVSPLVDSLYEEMLARIKEDDETVPYRRGGHFYYSRTGTGKEYPIMCRGGGRLDGPEDVVLDLNALAAGHPFFALGMSTVSDDGHLLAYTTDLTGFREYTLYVKDLRTGDVLADRVAR